MDDGDAWLAAAEAPVVADAPAAALPAEEDPAWQPRVWVLQGAVGSRGPRKPS